MLLRSELRSTTPSTLLLGVASANGRSAATAAIRMATGDIESDCGQWVAGTSFEVVTMALDELRLCSMRQLVLLTTDMRFHAFLQPPIYVQQDIPVIHMVGRQPFRAKIGGDPHQWLLLRLLFPYVWNCLEVKSLPKAEDLLR